MRASARLERILLAMARTPVRASSPLDRRMVDRVQRDVDIVTENSPTRTTWWSTS
ncbi:MAG: hypothetical protein U1E53_04700 [Dongiaceae bacterium]